VRVERREAFTQSSMGIVSRRSPAMMTLLRRLLVAALIAGGASGVLLGAAQVAFITPLILEAEVHERRDSSRQESAQQAWAPKNGVERNVYTVLFSTLAGFGFALLLNAGMLLRGQSGIKQGLLWGCAGFAVFSLAPALGLPPELPGVPAANLLGRQTWWLSTVLATAFGLSCVAFSRRPWARVLGIAALVLPHLIGPPSGVVSGQSSVDHLEGAYVATSLLTMFLFWVILGTLSSYLQNRLLASTGSDASFARSQ
jgi:cobalt transporter subunit CbtA